jgi:hypothetical protein
MYVQEINWWWCAYLKPFLASMWILCKVTSNNEKFNVRDKVVNCYQIVDAVLHCFSYFNFSCYINTLHIKTFFSFVMFFFINFFSGKSVILSILLIEN